MLHDTVLDAMKGDDGKTAPRRECRECRRKAFTECPELVIRSDTECLKGLRRMMDAALLIPTRGPEGYGRDKRPGREDALLCAGSHDGARDGAREALLPVAVEEICELGLGGAIDDIGRRLPTGSIGHEERLVCLGEGEA